MSGRYVDKNKNEVNREELINRGIRLMSDVGCSQRVINHVIVVEIVAEIIADCISDRGYNIKKSSIILGAILHDIGRSKTHGIRHAVEGAKIASELGLSDLLIKIIENHIGGGIDKREAVIMGLPEKNYFPATLEEKIVSHADNLVADNKIAGISWALEKFISKGLYDAAERIKRLHIYLSDICKKDIDKLVRERIKDKSLYKDEIEDKDA